MKIHEKTILVRPEHLNHVGALFGGYMMKWSDEMAYNAATLTFPGATFVTKLFNQFDFIRPVKKGEIIKIFSQVQTWKNTSVVVKIWAKNSKDELVYETSAVMVNFDGTVKKPLPLANIQEAF